MVVIAYIIIVLLVFFAITSFPQVLTGGLIGRITNILIGALVGSITTWLLIDLLWLKIMGNHIPILALGLSIITLFIHGYFDGESLTKISHQMMAAEAWAIILVGIYIIIISNNIQWI